MGIQADLATIVDGTTTAAERQDALNRAAAATGSGGGPQQRTAVAAFARPLVATLMHLISEAAAGSRNVRVNSEERSSVEVLLRLLRNACAEPSAADTLAEAELVPQMAEALSVLAGLAATSPPAGEVQAAAQLLANWASSVGESGRERLWAAVFPAAVTAIAASTDAAVQAPLCLALAAFCRGSSTCSAALIEPPRADPAAGGPPLLCALLDAAATGSGGGNEDLVRLVSVMVYSHGQLEGIVRMCEAETLRRASEAAMVRTRVDYTLELLQELSDSPWNCYNKTADLKAGAPARVSIEFLLDFVRDNARAATLPSSGAKAVDHLRAGLQLLRSLTSADEESGRSNHARFREIAGVLCEIGAVDLLLALLKALPSVTPAGAAASRASANGAVSSSGSAPQPHPMVEPCPQLVEEATRFPASNIFLGYRSYLVAVIGNMAFQQPAVQHAVTERGGVELVLAQCQVEDSSPMLREWGLWAIRNLTEGNNAAQQRIRELEVCQTVDTPELQAMGKQLEYDRASGKMKLVEREQQQEEEEGEESGGTVAAPDRH